MRERPRVLRLVTALVMAFLLLPVVVVAVFSLNGERSLVRMGALDTRWYRTLAHDGDVLSSLAYSLEIAVATAVISTALGTALAIGLRRASRVPARTTDAAILLRLVAPETATAVALLLLFTQLSIPLSTGTLLAAHVALTLAFVAVLVRSRLANLDGQLEEAALDLGATPLQAIRLVILPLVAPAIAAGALLSFVLSFDNFITSFFATGIGTQPLPVRIYSMLRVGVTPEVNAIGVLMLAIVTLVLGGSWAVGRAVSKRRGVRI
ncbi:MAG TPA: ABC transporter permease [Baekduia sp.]|uniref:ABC transporter permease n=1 Tax=Baekduia sp. TaxID=2600305 RepID=UPI002D795C7B|nr:ABC transporter permease [Baekduia sp.]HET6507353.1 ABC transporter permease [Baekduia sp.]